MRVWDSWRLASASRRRARALSMSSLPTSDFRRCSRDLDLHVEVGDGLLRLLDFVRRGGLKNQQVFEGREIRLSRGALLFHTVEAAFELCAIDAGPPACRDSSAAFAPATRASAAARSSASPGRLSSAMISPEETESPTWTRRRLTSPGASVRTSI